jgi:hypothetical protein
MLSGAAAGAAIFVHFAPRTKVSRLAALSFSMWQVMQVSITANVAADRDGQTAWAVLGKPMPGIHLAFSFAFVPWSPMYQERTR